uniref:Uncharacterized protein n=1 Tax=Physcomitrium patens TaxID=3218 RepID=A0A2K1ITX5_PHYPA|nr:hypothetical protein PHYPA_024672 [Physcomitrium patens]
MYFFEHIPSFGYFGNGGNNNLCRRDCFINATTVINLQELFTHHIWTTPPIMLCTPTFPTTSPSPPNSFKCRGISTGIWSFPIAGSMWSTSGASYGWIDVGFVSFQWEWKSLGCRIWLVASLARMVCAQGRPIDAVNPPVYKGSASVDGRFAITSCLCTSFSANKETLFTTSR